MVKVSPATVSVPVRVVFPVLASTEYLTVPSPEPFAPEVTVIQGTLLKAV